ncbi:hypothetical protein KEJ26_02545 [Candidatus Bathyarchaeota archaeon]|nr:hypothetical protein [Candidatus Bathyarchaeota archaeon]
MSGFEIGGPEEKFQNFLKVFQTKTGEYKYRQRIAQMAVTGSRSLIVDFEDILTFDSAFAKNLIEKPDEYISYANKAAWAQLKIEDPEYAEEVKTVHVRFRGLPEKVPLRAIGAERIGKLAMTDGILVRATPVKPLLVKAAFRCRRCGTIQYVEQSGLLIKPPLECAEPSCKRRGQFEFVEGESLFINSQEIRVQERPEDLPPGQLPRSMDVKLLEDLVDIARPGDRISVIGIVRATQEVLPRRGRLRTFDLYFDANYIDVAGKEVEVIQITAEEERQILELAKDPWIHRKIIRSIAPSIYGYEEVKEAIMLLLFSGIPKTLPDGVTIRGDINLLLIGDPGTAKSQLLQYVSRIAPRGLYTSGRGTSIDYSEPIMIRENGIAKIVKIGEFIDSYYPIGKSGYVVPVSGIETLSFDPNTFEVKWSPLQYVYRHEAPAKLYKLRLETGREVTLTSDHCVFIFENGEMRTKETSQIKVGDFVAIPSRIPEATPTVTEVTLPDGTIIPLNAALMRLLGYYIANGYLHYTEESPEESYCIHFEFGSRDQQLIHDTCRISEELFHVTPSLQKHRDGDSTVVTISSKKALMLYRDVLKVKQCAHDKEIPPIVFNVSKELQEEFLNAYIKGDRGVSVSKRLISDVLYLLLQIGGQTGEITRRKVDEHIIAGCRVAGIPAFQLKVPDPYQTNNPTIKLYPPGAVRGFFQRCNDNGLVERKVENGTTCIRLAKRTENIITRILRLHRLIENGHLAFAEVREIEIVNPTSPYVYDVSTPNYENFVAGLGGVICHNTAAGLTAAVVREKAGGLVLEAGALVLSDKGICSIDEFDKMKPEDRVAIHEVMEQQTVSVAKGGIVATLNARSSILAAANPALGRYDPYRTVAENINLPVTVLSRFDLIFVLKDVPQRETDTKMSEHILGLHKTGSTPVEPPIPPQLLRKYIAYAKRVKPVLSDEAMKRFEEFYLRMRAASESRESPIAITPRQLESLVRLSEARARAALRSEVSAEDAEAVIALVKKSLEQVGIDVTTGKYDIDIIMTGKPKTLRDRLTEVLATIVSMEKETGMVKLEDLYDRLMKDYEIDKTEADRLISQLTREGTIYSPKLGYVKKT